MPKPSFLSGDSLMANRLSVLPNCSCTQLSLGVLNVNSSKFRLDFLLVLQFFDLCIPHRLEHAIHLGNGNTVLPMTAHLWHVLAILSQYEILPVSESHR